MKEEGVNDLMQRIAGVYYSLCVVEFAYFSVFSGIIFAGFYVLMHAVDPLYNSVHGSLDTLLDPYRKAVCTHSASVLRPS